MARQLTPNRVGDNARPPPGAQITFEQVIEDEIQQLKLITGDVRSPARRMILGTLALAGFAAVRYLYLLNRETGYVERQFKGLEQALMGITPDQAAVEKEINRLLKK